MHHEAPGPSGHVPHFRYSTLPGNQRGMLRKLRNRRSEGNAPGVASMPAARQKHPLYSGIFSEETQAIWRDVLGSSCRRPDGKSSAEIGNGLCSAIRPEPNKIDAALLRELQKFFTGRGMNVNVRTSPAQALMALHRQMQEDAVPAAPSFHDGVLPQSNAADDLVRHLSIAHFFYSEPATHALRIDPSFASRQVAECLMALLGNGLNANALRFNEFDFSKALRIAKPVAAVKMAFAALLALKFGVLPKDIRQWAASMMLRNLQPTLARNDTPPHVLYGSLEWAYLAFGIDVVGNLGLDHGDYPHDQIAGIAKLMLDGAKFNEIVAKEAWRMSVPAALQFAHAQKKFDLGSHDIGNPHMVQNVIRHLERAHTAQLTLRDLAMKGLEKQPRSRAQIARTVLEKWGCEPDVRPGRTGWQIFLGRRLCEGDPTILEAYLKDCFHFVRHACHIASGSSFRLLEDETRAEWSEFDIQHGEFFSPILADALHQSAGDYLRDWGGNRFIIYRPLFLQSNAVDGGKPEPRQVFANIGILVETGNAYFSVSANNDSLIRRIDAGGEAGARDHVKAFPHYYLSQDKRTCDSPCVESKITGMLRVTEKALSGQYSLQIRIDAVAQALAKHLDGEAFQSTLLFDAARLSKRRHTPFSACFNSGDARQLEQDLALCGLDLEQGDLNVLGSRPDSQTIREQTSDAILTREIRGSVLAMAASRLAEQLPGATMPSASHHPTTLYAALDAMRNAGREEGALDPGFRLMPQDALQVAFLTSLMKMMEAAPSAQNIRRDLEKSRRLRLVYAPGIGWQADGTAAPGTPFAPQSGYQLRDIGAAKNVLVKNLQQASGEPREHSIIFVRVSPFTDGIFGPAMDLNRPAVIRPAVLPSSFSPGAIADRPGYAGLRFAIAAPATASRIMHSRLDTRDIFTFDLNGRIYQVDMNAYVPRLRLYDDILAERAEAPICRDERGARKKDADARNRCLTLELSELDDAGMRFEHVYPGHARQRDDYVQQEPVEGRICQLPRREQTIIFPDNQGDFRDLNVIIVDGMLYLGGADKTRHVASPARNASAPQYKRLGERGRVGMGLPQIEPLHAEFGAQLIDQGSTRRPLIQYVRHSELRPSDAATNEITRISTRIRRDFLSRRSSAGSPAMGLIEVEEDIFYKFALPPGRQGAVEEVWLTRVSDQAYIDAFKRQVTVAEMMLSERFSIDIAPGHAQTFIDIFRKCNMNDVLYSALQQEKAMRQLAGGNDTDIDYVLLSYIDAEIDASPTLPVPVPVLGELEIALTAMMKSPARTAEFRHALRERYQDQRRNVVFNEVYIPPLTGTEPGPETLHISGAVRALQDEWKKTCALFNDIYPELALRAVSSAQEVHAAFVRVFDSRNVAIMVLETDSGQVFYLDSVSGTRPVPTRSTLAENDINHVLVREISETNEPNILPFLTNLLWNFETQSRDKDTERVLFSWVLARFPRADAIVKVKLISRLEICHSCVTCCISFAEHYSGATMQFSGFSRAFETSGPVSTTEASRYNSDLK